ncbi:MAG: YraN family protein [Fusobacterium sp.]|nr:YraN family protein [Fusobacterium sp.]
MNKREIGNIYEDRSCEILKEQNYKILERNYQNKFGEIDIIAKKEQEIIFIEVKYRKTKNYGYGYEAINKRKLQKIFKLAQFYIQNEELHNYRVRFDCMSYLSDDLEWIKNIAWGDEIGF